MGQNRPKGAGNDPPTPYTRAGPPEVSTLAGRGLLERRLIRKWPEVCMTRSRRALVGPRSYTTKGGASPFLHPPLRAGSFLLQRLPARYFYADWDIAASGDVPRGQKCPNAFRRTACNGSRRRDEEMPVGREKWSIRNTSRRMSSPTYPTGEGHSGIPQSHPCTARHLKVLYDAGFFGAAAENSADGRGVSTEP